MARQANQCSTAKSRKQLRNINKPWGVTVSMGERPSQRDFVRVCLYAEHLTQCFQSPQSVRNYISGLRLLLKYLGIPCHTLHSFDGYLKAQRSHFLQCKNNVYYSIHNNNSVCGSSLVAPFTVGPGYSLVARASD